MFIEIFMIFRSIYLPAPKGVKYVLSGGVKLPFLSRNLSGLNTSGSGNTTGSRHPDRRLAVTLTPVKQKQSFIWKIEGLKSFCLCVYLAPKQGSQIWTQQGYLSIPSNLKVWSFELSSLLHVVTYEMPIDKPKQVGLLSKSQFYYDRSILSQPPGNT